MSGHRLESVSGQLAGREIVPQHRVQGVDELAARRHEPDAAPIHARGHASPRGALAQPRRTDAAERERHAQPPRAPFEKRQIEAVQVVVLDDVRIDRLHPRDEPRNQRSFVTRVRRLEHFRGAGVVAQRHHEDPIAPGVEAGRLEIDLHAMQPVERQTAKVGPAGCDQVLLIGGKREHACLPELAQVGDLPSEPPGGAVPHRRRQESRIRGAHEVAERAGSLELLHGDTRIRSLGAQPRPQVAQVVETIEQHPRAEGDVFPDQRAGFGNAAPDHRASVGLGPHRDDPRCLVPAPQPFVFHYHGDRSMSRSTPASSARRDSIDRLPALTDHRSGSET